jgi:hypothetical protein
MSSTDLVTRQPGQLAVPQGARALGQRVKPIIRLGMGRKVEGTRKDGSTYTRPEKTDHFTVRGDERAVAKFKSVYGDKPKSVKIMVPSELGLALDISYRAFVGGGDEDGGRPLALGFTNFATLGYVGGPDVLRVWRQDGTYAEVETLGLDERGAPLDEIAKDLKIEVYATFTFTIPEVLGWGSFAAVTSKGKKSADNLAFKLGQIYSAFGAKAPWAFDRDEPPMLVLKPDTALMRFEDKDGSAKWGKTKIFVLDVVIPEAFDKMVDRIAARQREIAPAGPAAALYPAALEAGTEVSSPEESGDGQAAEAVSEPEGPSSSETGQAGVPAGTSAAEPEPEEGEWKVPESVATDDADVLAANEAAEAIVPFGKHKGLTLRELIELGAEGEGRIRWALRQWKTDPFKSQVWAFAKVYVPDVYEECKGSAEGS